MTLSEQRFRNSLKIGEEGENIVYSWLIKNNDFVEDLRSQKRGHGSGPRLIGTEGSLVLPDFAVYNPISNKGNFVVDSKVKNKIYTVDGLQCFTVDNKYEQYKKVVQIKNLDFLAIAFVFNKQIYFYKDTECCGITEYNNNYGKGNVYLFEFNKSHIVY